MRNLSLKTRAISVLYFCGLFYSHTLVAQSATNAIDDSSLHNTIGVTNNQFSNNSHRNGITGPGGNTANLGLWLKATDGLNYVDGQPVSLWADQGNGANATVNTTGQEPTYRDNTTHNINFNPVVEFDNTFSTAITDSDYSFDNTSTQFLEGTSGLYTQDLFIVIIPDETAISNDFGFMEVLCGDSDSTTNERDTSGIGFGDFSGRITGESISFALDSYDETDTGDGYAVHDGNSASYSNVGIINTRNNLLATQQELYYNANNIETTQNDITEFTNVSNSRFWLGRSEGCEASLNARVAEVITFSSRLSDTDLTDERNRVQSYLAIKYGITLGANGVSQDYVDSNGDLIWNQLANAGYNYDIAGIGRDDNSKLNQKQSSSANNATDAQGPTEGILTMGLTNIYDTNNSNKINNSNTINDKNFLVWGNNNASLDAIPNTISTDLSSGITSISTPVNFISMQRVWKVVEKGGDVGKVQVSLPQNAVRNTNGEGDYLMFISDSEVFDHTSDYRLMTLDGSNLKTEYDFNATKYITFGFASKTTAERSVNFDGTLGYIDMKNALDLNASEFSVSAWIKSENSNASIASKRDAAYTEGYDLKILSNRHVEMSWLNGTIQSIQSSTQIPENEWHQIAVIYNGQEASLYIDGVLDNKKILVPPVSTSQSFFIAAAGKNTPSAYFKGNIDEVRVWNIALEEKQLRYLMNQEIVDNAAFVNGKIIPHTITKNEAASIPWSYLAGYYPMSTFTYSSIYDASGNNYHIKV